MGKKFPKFSNVDVNINERDKSCSHKPVLSSHFVIYQSTQYSSHFLCERYRYWQLNTNLETRTRLIVFNICNFMLRLKCECIFMNQSTWDWVEVYALSIPGTQKKEWSKKWTEIDSIVIDGSRGDSSGLLSMNATVAYTMNMNIALYDVSINRVHNHESCTFVHANDCIRTRLQLIKNSWAHLWQYTHQHRQTLSWSERIFRISKSKMNQIPPIPI